MQIRQDVHVYIEYSDYVVDIPKQTCLFILSKHVTVFLLPFRFFWSYIHTNTHAHTGLYSCLPSYIDGPTPLLHSFDPNLITYNQNLLTEDLYTRTFLVYQFPDLFSWNLPSQKKSITLARPPSQHHLES